MRCGYGLAALPGTDARFFSTETSFLRLARTVHPTRIKFGSFKIRAKIDEARKEVSFYELLGISETGTLLEIKQAYKQLARKYHPDVSPPDRIEENTERFIRVQEAYETLSDPRRRALYDKDLTLGIHLAFSARRRYQSDEENKNGAPNIYLHRPIITRSPLSQWGEGGIIPFKPFFHAFLGGPGKAAINRVFVIPLLKGRMGNSH